MYQNQISIVIILLSINLFLLLICLIQDSNAINKADFNVKISFPQKNAVYSMSDLSIINGSSTYDPNSECFTSILINNHKPYLKTLPKGDSNSNDFSFWIFDVDKIDKVKYLTIGPNTITAKNHCLNTGSSSFFKTSFNLTDSNHPNTNVKPTEIKNGHYNNLYNVNNNYLITPSNSGCCENIAKLNHNNGNNGDDLKNSSTIQKEDQAEQPVTKNKNPSNNFVETIQDKLNHLSQVKQNSDNGASTYDDYLINDNNKKNSSNNVKHIQSLIEEIIK